MEHTTPLTKQIDHVLNILQDHQSTLYFDDVKNKINNSKMVIEPSVLRMLLEKLIRDNYAYMDMTQPTEAYNISFEGNLFKGYEKQIKTNRVYRRLARIQSWTLAIGTGLAGLYGLYEILKWIDHRFYGWHIFF